MSLQGSWCDAVIVQAVAESQNLRIHIVESHENFAHTTLIEPIHLSQQLPVTIYLGHVNEVHYVSTVPYTCSSNSLETQHSDNHLNITGQNFFSEKSHAGLTGSETRPFGAAAFLPNMVSGAIFNFFKFIKIYFRVLFELWDIYGVCERKRKPFWKSENGSFSCDVFKKNTVSTRCRILLFHCVCGITPGMMY